MTPEDFHQQQIRTHERFREDERIRRSSNDEKTVTITRKQLKGALMQSVYLDRKFCPSQQIGGVTASTWDYLLELSGEPQKI